MNKEYIVKDGIFYKREIREIELGSPSNILEKAKTQGIVIFPDVFTITVPTMSDYANNTVKEEAIKIPVHLGRNSTSLYVAHRLLYYPLFADFTFDNEEIDIEQSDIVKQPISYTYETTARVRKLRVPCDYPGLWLIYCFKLTNHRISGFQLMYLTTNIRGQHFAPLLPNIHNNGKICMGELRAIYNGDLQDCIARLFNDFFMSASNTHLMRNEGYNALQFNFQKTDGKIKTEWAPPEVFNEHPIEYHNNRGTTIAADFLEELTTLENTDD